MTTVIGFAGFSNSGKTTLISKLVRHFAGTGLKTAVIKHDAHGHYKEAEGTDSSVYKEAGATAAIVVSPDSYTVFRREACTLEQLLDGLRTESYDLIMVEGFKNSSHPKIALYRTREQAGIVNHLSSLPVAYAAPAALRELSPAAVPFFEIDDIASIAAWIEERITNFSV